MFTEKTFNKLITICRKQIHLPDGSFRHFSFILDGKKQISFGWNLGFKTDPLSKKFGQRYQSVHSEIMAIKLFPYKPLELANYQLVNIRLNKKMEPALAAPCKFCQKMLQSFGMSDVVWSNNEGGFSCE